MPAPAPLGVVDFIGTDRAARTAVRVQRRTRSISPAGGRAPGPSPRSRSAAVETPSSPNPSSSECGVAIALPTGKPEASVRMKLLALGALPAGGPVIVQPSRSGLERGARAVRQRDVVDEDADALGGPVAGVGDRDLDRLAGVVAEVDAPLLPAARVAARRVPRAGGAGRRAAVDVRSTSGSGRAAGAGRPSRPAQLWPVSVVVCPLASGSVVQSSPPGVRASTNRWSQSASVSYDVQNVSDPPPAGTATSRVSRL